MIGSPFAKRTGRSRGTRHAMVWASLGSRNRKNAVESLPKPQYTKRVLTRRMHIFRFPYWDFSGFIRHVRDEGGGGFRSNINAAWFWMRAWFAYCEPASDRV